MNNNEIIKEISVMITRWLRDPVDPHTKVCAEELSALRDRIVAGKNPA